MQKVPKIQDQHSCIIWLPFLTQECKMQLQLGSMSSRGIPQQLLSFLIFTPYSINTFQIWWVWVTILLQFKNKSRKHRDQEEEKFSQTEIATRSVQAAPTLNKKAENWREKWQNEFISHKTHWCYRTLIRFGILIFISAYASRYRIDKHNQDD